MDYEDIIENIGGFGRWQILIFVLLILPDIFFCLSIMLPVFIGPEPDWICMNYVNNSNNYDNMLANNVNNYFNSSLIILEKNNSTETELQQCNVCDKRQYVDDFTSIVSEWDLVCDRDYVSDLISTIQMSGFLFGAALFGQTSDRFGRKTTHYVTIALSVMAGCISAFSVNWQMFAVFRFIFGVSAGGYFCLNCVYPMEFVSRKWRALAGSLTIWGIGQLILALMAYYIRQWHHLTFWTAVVGIPYIVTYFFIPESPRWLAQRGKLKQAKMVFNQIARRNNKPLPDLTCLDKLIVHKEQAERDLDQDNHMTKYYTYLDLFKSWYFIKTTILTMFIWCVIFLVYYTNMMNIKHLSGDRYLNQVYGGLMDSLGMLLVLVFINILGRRRCLIIAALGGLIPNITLYVIYYLNKEDELGNVINIVSLVQRLFTSGSTILIGVYSAEVFPTDVRNIGVGAGSIAGRVGMLLGPQFVFLGTRYKTIPYLVMSILCVALLPIYSVLPETTGEPLVDDYNLVTVNTSKQKKPLPDEFGLK